MPAEPALKWLYLLPVWEQPLSCSSRASPKHSLFPGMDRVEFLARCTLYSCRSRCHWGSAELCQASLGHFLPVHNVCKSSINQSCSSVERAGKELSGPGEHWELPWVFMWGFRAWAGVQGALRWNCEDISGQISVKYLEDTGKDELKVFNSAIAKAEWLWHLGFVAIWKPAAQQVSVLSFSDSCLDLEYE